MDFSNTRIKLLTTHIVGNKINEEGIKLSENLTVVNENTNEYLLQYFFNNFKIEEYYSLSNKVNLSLNTIYVLASEIFSNIDSFKTNSENIAKHLYDQSTHPKIKMGELHVAYFSNCRINNETCDAIGIFKSETKDTFLKFYKNESNFEIDHEQGISLNKVDKACLIFNTEKKKGFKVCVYDSINKGDEAHFWKNNFLSIMPCSDEFHHTNNYLKITKDFVTKQINEEFEVSKTDTIDLLNRSVEYFKVNENFDEREFTREVFNNPEVIESFKRYKNDFTKDNAIELDDDFTISVPALKKQARIFKSVLKLDKNFHIYIHGNKELIEKGTEADGRKYYKVYYTEES